MQASEIAASDQRLIDAAIEVIRRNYDAVRHTVGAAVLCGSGRTYSGINIEACAYGPCAEPIALGAAFANGEREIVEIVAVEKYADGWVVLSPCGNCRQMLLDYAPHAWVICRDGDKTVKAGIRELLPAAYRSSF